MSASSRDQQRDEITALESILNADHEEENGDKRNFWAAQQQGQNEGLFAGTMKATVKMDGKAVNVGYDLGEEIEERSVTVWFHLFL